jgi:phage terminase large subunit
VRVDFAPSVKQDLAWQALEDATHKEVCYGGAAGGGKSYLGAYWKIYRRLRYPGTRGLTGRTVAKDLRESTLITFFKVLSEMGLKSGRDFTFNSNAFRIDFKNGSREIFRDLGWNPSDPDYQRLGSLEITDAWIEEAGDGLPKKAADILRTRIRWMLPEYGLTAKMLLTCNPGYHWVRNTYFYDAEDNPVVLKPTQIVVRALVSDNPDPAFAAQYKAQLEDLDSDYDRQRLLEGDWNAVERTGGEMYPGFSTETHTAYCAAEYDPEHPLHVTFDFNTVPYMTCCVWQVWGTRVVQIAEICPEAPDNNTPATCKLFMEKFGQHEGEVFIYGDPAGKHADTRSEKGHNDFSLILKHLKKLPQVTKRVSASAPSVSARALWINAIFKNQEGGIELVIDKACRNTIQDYQKVKKAPDGTKDKRTVKNPLTGISYQPYGHISDANEYFLCRIFAEEYKVYRGRKQAKNPAEASPEAAGATPPKPAEKPREPRAPRSLKQRY